ncbi:dihydrofolate reductase [Massilia sp. CFBP9012]|uniref:dihydrofolate reductase n=1 Tax=Massilia sp. CFBP9012 TaxID=3096531 RepID=UPI002A6A5109|nr:dihydrofolate reductase [Massilia sp. CFBP9012]MDY0975800.1 dihydrofolate reductase [Massilia sp. CFBP9012]
MSDAARLTLVVAVDANNGIGVDNKMPWHLPEDFAHFKRVTLGKPVIMGRKTFDSIGRVLPGRRNIVITRNADWSHEGAERATSLDAAIAMLDGAPASIIGGAQVFAQAMDIADAMIVTHIGRVFDCDTFFPPIDAAVWRETARDTHHSQANGFDYAFVTYARRGAMP